MFSLVPVHVYILFFDKRNQLSNIKRERSYFVGGYPVVRVY